MQTEQIKINWYPVIVPPTVDVLALDLAERREFDESQGVRQYRREDRWLAIACHASTAPAGFAELTVPCQDLPMFVSGLILDSLLSYFQTSGYRVERGKGESHIYRRKSVADLPDSIEVFDGLRIKSYCIPQGQSNSFGLVIDYTSAQEFSHSLAEDVHQVELARNGCELVGLDAQGSRVSGFLADIQADKATLVWRDKRQIIPLSALRLQSSYDVIQAYAELAYGHVQAKSIIRRLQIESLSLTQDGYRNLNQLSARYRLISEMLGREKNGNLNIRLNTLCGGIASMATEPIDLEVKQ